MNAHEVAQVEAEALHPAETPQSTPANTETWPEGHPYNTLKDCDVVMKGGITSGVVYPSAVRELAKTYRLHSIGGTSAGAIAAAAAAAAELGRWQRGDDAPFDDLACLPHHLGKPSPHSTESNLFNLFQPQPSTRAIFHTAVAALGDDQGKALRVIAAATRNFPWAAVVGVIPGILLLLLAIDSMVGWIAFFGGLFAIMVGIVLYLLTLAAAVGWQALRGLNGNFFGFCTGMPNPPRAEGKVPKPLSEWLADYLDQLAGISDRSTPLTFGDLRWGIGKRARATETKEEQKPDYHYDPAINLTMITTSLTLGRPYNLPFSTRIFYFDPEEWRKLFPARVVEWLVKHPPADDDDGRNLGKIVVNEDGSVLLPLPVGDDLPVVVATRMSLSFPILLSAIPLYAVDYTRKFNQTPAKAKEDTREEDETAREVVTAERCWFSDGGIAINFPIHFFDRPLPRWPTFAINLSLPHLDYPITCLDDAKKIWMPEKNLSGAQPTWTRFQTQSNFSHLFSFLGSILYTARTWMDQMQMIAPGYRDRIVHIYLEPSEGGLNLNMPDKVITSMAARGTHAAARLVEHFASPPETHTISWDNHRWIRYRTSMTMIEELLEAVKIGHTMTMPGERSYAELVDQAGDKPPKSYPLTDKGKCLAKANTTSLLKLADEWAQNSDTFETKMAKDTPQPKPEMQIRPRI